MDKKSTNELIAIKRELQNIIDDLYSISGGVARDFEGISNEKCSRSIVGVAQHYEKVKRKLSSIDTETLSPEFEEKLRREEEKRAREEAKRREQQEAEKRRQQEAEKRKQQEAEKRRQQEAEKAKESNVAKSSGSAASDNRNTKKDDESLIDKAVDFIDDIGDDMKDGLSSLANIFKRNNK